MKDESANPGGPTASATETPSLPAAVDRAAFQAELDALRVRRRQLIAYYFMWNPGHPAAAQRPIAQWPRLVAGRSDDLSTAGR
jgi:hypothetical protein